MKEERGLSSSEQYVKNSNKKLVLIGVLFLIIGFVAWLFISEYKTEMPDQTSIDFSTQDFDTMSGKKTDLALFPRGTATLNITPKQVDMNNVVLGSKAESVITLTAQNAPILFLGADLAEMQPDGFTIETSCVKNARIEPEASCNIKVLWNPVALRQIQNILTVRWKEDSPSVFREEKTTVEIKAQSTDSKDCVICEDIRKEAEKKPKMAMGLDGKLYEVDEDGFVTIDGKKYKVTENGLLVDENGNIVGVAAPDLIPIGIDNQFLGTISDTQDVIAPNGDKLGRLLGDNTIVDSSLKVLGAAVPVVSVMDDGGNVIAKMMPDGTVVDSTNQAIGRPLVDGSVIDLNGAIIGSLRPWGLVIDFSGNVIGGIIPDGTVVNAQNQPVARVTSTGLAIDANNELVGGVVVRGVAVSAGCQSLGEITLNGQVKDNYEQIIGRVLPDGMIVSADNKELGAAVRQGLVINEKGEILGFVNSEGKAVDAKGSVIGCVNPDGSITAGKRIVGAVMKKGRVIGRACQAVGSVYPDGSAVSFVGDYVGQVMSDGYVKTPQSQIIGVVVPYGTAIAEGCRLLGLIDINGQIRNTTGLTIGCVTPERTVVNTQNEVIGGITPRGSVIDPAGKVIGRIRLDGKVMDESGKVIGCANPNGTVTTLDGKLIGSVVDENGNPVGWQIVGDKIYDANGNLIGTIMPDGTIVDANGNVIGRINPDGTIVDANGNVIGKINDLNGEGVRVLPDGTIVDANGNIIGKLGDNNGTTGSSIPEGVILDANGNPTGWTVVGNKVYDANGNLIGEVQPNGWIVDENGNVVGIIHPDGVIFSPEGQVLGRYSKQTGSAVNLAGERFAQILPDRTAVSLDKGQVIGALIPDKATFADLTNSYLGTMQIDGQLLGSAGERLGTIRADGTVVDQNGKLIGTRILSGRVFSVTGKEVASVNDKGEVFSLEQSKIGHVLGNGIAVSNDGNVLGKVFYETPILAVGAEGILGSVGYTGAVQDKSGRRVGLATPFGLVLDSTGEVIGKTVRIGAYMGLDTQTLGWSGFDGSVTSKGTVLGKVAMDGALLDKENVLLGTLIPQGSVINEQGKFLSAVAPTGDVLSATGTRQGSLSTSMFAYDTSGAVIGRLLTPGVAVDLEGAFMGWTRFDGAVENNKQVLGYVSFDNRVLTVNGNVVGTYIPFGASIYNDEGKALGFVSEKGTVINMKGQEQGSVMAPTTVISKGKMVGRVMLGSTFVTDLSSGKILGQTAPNGTVMQVGGGKVLGSLLMNHQALNMTKQVLGGQVTDGLMLGNNLTLGGQVLTTGGILVGGKNIASQAGTSVVFNKQGGVLGGVYAPDTFIGRDGAVIGTSTATAAIFKNGKKVASYMPFGSALSPDNLWAGGRIPFGIAVTDDAIEIGVVTADGAVIGADNAFMARIMTDGAAVGVTERGLYATMPYVGAIAKQGLALGYKGDVVGYTTVSGDIVDASDKKVYRILDDGSILGTDTPLAGIVIPFGTAVDQKGGVLGSLNGDGKLVGYTGETVGTVAANGAIKGNSNLKILGAMIPEPLITNDCKVVGQTAYNGQVINGRGEVVGYVQPDKWAVNSKGEKIGRVTRNGLVLSPEGDYLGRTMPDSTVVDPKGVNMGCAKNDGSVVDNAGNVIGHIVDRGPVFDLDGNMIGRVKANGMIVDGKNTVIGKMLGDGKGTAINLKGDVIGRMASRDEELIFNPDGTLAGTFALDGTYRDPTGLEVFKVLSDGSVIDPKTGRRLGKLGENGELLDEKGNPMDDITVLRDKNGNLLGIITGCDVINSAGEKIASIMPDGSIIDLNGERFGTILGNGILLAPDGSEMGKVSGTSTKLDRCGIKSVSRKGSGDGSSASGRRIFIGNKVFGITANGSLVDEDGTVVGYMGEDGRPYSLDNKLLTGTDSTGRKRPDLNKKVPVNTEQLQQMQQLLAQKRSGMRDGVKKASGVLKPSARTLARGKRKQDKDWGLPKIVSTWPVDMSRMILKDKAIPAVIVHSIDSRYSTVPVTAIVERHVYAEEGRNIIIPAGSRLIGSFGGSPGSDHVAKMEISWSRLIRPDGSAFQISGTSGDAQGRGGVAAYLSEELIQRYGKPVLTASVTSAIAYMTAVNEDITTKDNGDQVQSAKSEAATSARDNFVDAMGEIFNQLLDESTSVKPVVFVPAGTRITVFAGEDLWLRSADDDEEELTEEFGAEGTAAQTPPVGSWIDNRGGLPQVTGAEMPVPSQEEYYAPEDMYQPIGLEDARSIEMQTQPVGQTTPSVNASTPIYNGAESVPLTDRMSKPLQPKVGASDRMF